MALTPKTKDELGRPVATPHKSNIRLAANTFSAQRSMADRWNADGTFRDGSISGSVFKGSKIQRPGGPEVLPEQTAARVDPRKTAAASAAASRIAQGDDIYSGEGIPPAQTDRRTFAATPVDTNDPFRSTNLQADANDPFRGPDSGPSVADPFVDSPAMTFATLQQFGAGDSLLMQAGAQAQAALTAAGDISSFPARSLSAGYQRLFSFNRGDSPFQTQTPATDESDPWSLKNSAMLRRTELFSDFNGGR